MPHATARKKFEAEKARLQAQHDAATKAEAVIHAGHDAFLAAGGESKDLELLYGQAWNALHDAIAATECAIADLENEFRWSKVDPNTRALIQANID